VVLEFACTQKVLKELKLAPASLPKPDLELPPQMSWYVELFELKRTKTLIFMNPSSGYVAISYGVNRKQIQKMPELFRGEFLPLTQYDEIPRTLVAPIVDEANEIRYCRTNDRRTLGHLNEAKRELLARIEYAEINPLPSTSTEMTASFNQGLYGPHWDPYRAFCTLLGMEGLQPRGRMG